jgi:hypothetical protein
MDEQKTVPADISAEGSRGCVRLAGDAPGAFSLKFKHDVGRPTQKKRIGEAVNLYHRCPASWEKDKDGETKG